MPNISTGLIRPHSSKLTILQRFTDVAIIVMSLVLCGKALDIELHQSYLFAVSLAVICFLLFAEIKSLYHSWRFDSLRNEITHVLIIWVSVIFALILLAFLTKTSMVYSRRLAIGWALLVPLLLMAFRIFLRVMLRSLRKQGRNTRMLAFAGDTALTRRLSKVIESSPGMGVRIAGIYDESCQMQPSSGSVEVAGDFADLVASAREGKIDYVYITLPMQEEKRTMQLIDELADTTTSVYVVPDFFVFELRHTRWLSVGGIPAVSVFESPFYGVDGWFKRAEDLVVGSIILLIISPLMLAIAAGVKLSSSGPVIFKQRRYGLHGEVIEVWKFRSMSVCEDGDNIPQAKLGDKRITRFGAFLRSTSLDELPQFINVLQGSMSIVGPRPHAVAHNEQYRGIIHGYMLRHKIKPGITGWAQINGWRGETDTLEKMQKRVEFDLEYMRNWSMWLDVKIIALTIWKGFSGKNAY
jgi:putative colanic acid biosynthesis UDP-glucose lipid carrier transferase